MPHRSPDHNRRSPAVPSSENSQEKSAQENPPRAARWRDPHLPPGAAPAAPRRWQNTSQETHHEAQQPADSDGVRPEAAHFSDEDWAQLVHEVESQRGRKLSRRQRRMLSLRAQKRHARAVQRQLKPPKPRRAKPMMPVWRHLRRITAILAIFAAGELTLAALTAPQFAVQEVTSDSAPVTPKAAIAAAEAQLLGQNWVRAKTAPCVDQLKKLPMVADAKVRREFDWPPRLHLAVIERQPFARVGTGENWWIVDREGVPFRRATPADEKLYAVSSRALSPELGKKLPQDYWKSVVEFADALAEDTKKGHDWALRAIYFDEHKFASLRLADTSPGAAPGDRLLVHLGTGQWHKKLQRAREALHWLETTGRRAEALNLVSYKKPVWTPRRTTPTAPEPQPVTHPA